MARHIVHYSLVRLLPQADAGEFANIGVVATSADTGFFGFRLLEKPERITGFFSGVTADLMARLTSDLRAQLTHTQKLVTTGPRSALPRRLEELAQPRETLIAYSPVRTAMVDGPEAYLDQLFVRYVQREPATL
jgi:hypothetical protein